MKEIIAYVDSTQKSFTKADLMGGLTVFTSFDSYMVPTEDLQLGERRLLEVTQRMQIPTHATVRALITSEDVIHS